MTDPIMRSFRVAFRDGRSEVVRGTRAQTTSQELGRAYIWNGEETVFHASLDDVLSITEIPAGSDSSSRMDAAAPEVARNTRKVFVVHGRDFRARDALFELLRALDLSPIEWGDAVALTGKAAPYV